MKKYIVAFFIIALLIGGCFYLVFSRHETLTITYIKFKVNPEFIVGINSKEKVVFYNPLNKDAKIFNLMMFNDKSLEEMCQIFYQKATENNYLTDHIINLTIMTTNEEKSQLLIKRIKDKLSSLNHQITVNSVEPTAEELVTYSNETVYDLKPTLNNDDLIAIGKQIETKLNQYVKNKLNSLKLNKLPATKQLEVINTKFAERYFDDYDLLTSQIDNYDIALSGPSSYNLEFTFNDDKSYTYHAIINLEFKYTKKEVVDDLTKGTVEVYKYTYDSANSKPISDYKNNFYKFNY